MYTSGKVLQNVDDDSSDGDLMKVTKLQRQLRDRTVFETSWYSYKGFVYNIYVRSQVDILTYYMPQSVCLFSMIIWVCNFSLAHCRSLARKTDCECLYMKASNF